MRMPPYAIICYFAIIQHPMTILVFQNIRMIFFTRTEREPIND